MSRLDSFIRRLEAQRACLDRVAAEVRDRPGPVLEVGLGNGRTYDHLRDRLPGRPIHAFDRQLAAHPACVPPDGLLLLGDIRQTVPAAAARLGPAVLIHSDIGSGEAAANAALAAAMAALYAAALAPGGLLLSDQPMAEPRLAPEALPPGVPEGRYFLYRRRAG
ncbi:MAG: class I SAM-dependent methyltransferase [Dongiaceae bacterium]